MKDKKEYIAPVLTVDTFKMERGFAASSFSICHIFLGEDADMTNNQESWETNDNAFGDSW